jgi:hypothetical protein
MATKTAEPSWGGPVMSDDALSEVKRNLLEGIEGWLVFPALFLVIVAFTVVDYLLDSPLPAARPEVMAGNVAVLVGSVVMLVLFFQKRRVVPMLMVVFYVTLVAVCLVEVLTLTRFAEGLDPAFVQARAQEARNGLGVVLSHAILWIPYFLVSRRVRNTFVE